MSVKMRGPQSADLGRLGAFRPQCQPRSGARTTDAPAPAIIFCSESIPLFAAVNRTGSLCLQIKSPSRHSPPAQSKATAAAVAPVFMNSLGDKNWVAAGRSAVISCSKTAPETSSTTRTQTELPFGGAAMNRVSTPPVAMAKLAPMSVSVGAPVPSFMTSCQRVCVPRWLPMPTCWKGAARARQGRRKREAAPVHGFGRGLTRCSASRDARNARRRHSAPERCSPRPVRPHLPPAPRCRSSPRQARYGTARPPRVPARSSRP